MTAKTLVLGIIKEDLLGTLSVFWRFCLQIVKKPKKQTVINMGVRQYPPPQKINIMLYYIISAEDMPNFVSSLIERWQITQQATPIESKQESDLMTIAETCKYLHVTAATLNNWHRVGYLTKVKIGRRVLYHRQDVEAIANPHKSN